MIIIKDNNLFFQKRDIEELKNLNMIPIELSNLELEDDIIFYKVKQTKNLLRTIINANLVSYNSLCELSNEEIDLRIKQINDELRLIYKKDILDDNYRKKAVKLLFLQVTLDDYKYNRFKYDNLVKKLTEVKKYVKRS